jgi:hypothetical protein
MWSHILVEEEDFSMKIPTSCNASKLLVDYHNYINPLFQWHVEGPSEVHPSTATASLSNKN